MVVVLRCFLVIDAKNNRLREHGSELELPVLIVNGAVTPLSAAAAAPRPREGPPVTAHKIEGHGSRPPQLRNQSPHKHLTRIFSVRSIRALMEVDFKYLQLVTVDLRHCMSPLHVAFTVAYSAS